MINPPSQKLQDLTTWSSWISKWHIFRIRKIQRDSQISRRGI